MNGWSSGLFSSCLATAAAYCGDGRGRVNLEIHMYKESWLVYEMVRSKGSRAASMPLLRTYCLLLLLSSYWGCRYQHSTATSNVKLLFIITNDRGWTKRRSSHHSRRRPRRCSHNRCPHTTSSSHKVFSSCTTRLGRRRPRALTGLASKRRSSRATATDPPNRRGRLRSLNLHLLVLCVANARSALRT